jgi:hypothetical protein
LRVIPQTDPAAAVAPRRLSLAAALHLAEPEQLRLPFVLERSWIGTGLRRDPWISPYPT